jgi:hypothetical protein
LRGRFRLISGIVAQDLAQDVAWAVAQVIFPVGSVFFIIVIVFVMNLILQKYRGSSGENRGYSAERRS